MLSIIKSMSLIGIEGYLIDVEVDVSAGIPSWEIVGLPDTSVKEAKERVRTAIRTSWYKKRRAIFWFANCNWNTSLYEVYKYF